jgi:hypothetical protein
MLEWLASYILGSIVAKVAAFSKAAYIMNSDDCIENWSVSWQTSTIIVSIRSISLFNDVAITAGYNIVVFF